MAAGTLSPPGTLYGPCGFQCRHTDCTETRRMANAPCLHCRLPIGYGTRFYDLRRYGALAHEACEEKAADGRAGAAGPTA